MTALTRARRTPEKAGTKTNVHGVKANAVCFLGGLAILAGGFLRAGREGQGPDNPTKAADAATYRCVGIFNQNATGGAADGTVTAEVRTGCFPFSNSAAGDLITAADIGKPCYIVDDQTVAKTSLAETRAVAGAVNSIQGAAVWVDVHPSISAALTA
jgi:hypothetical protein